MTSLKQVVELEGPLDFRRAARCTDGVAMQLSGLHARGILHRNVHPAVILLDRYGRVELTQPNLRYGDDTSPDESSILDVVGYLAPEQVLNNHTANARTDIYSLGCTLYFVLAGHPPFATGSISERLLQHLVAAIPDVAADRPGAPVELADLCKRMMAKKPVDRPASAAEVSAALNGWLTDEGAA